MRQRVADRQTPTTEDLKAWWGSGERIGAQTTRVTLRLLAATAAAAGVAVWNLGVPTMAATMGQGTRPVAAAALWGLAVVLAVAGSWRYGAVKADFLRHYQRNKIYAAIDGITTNDELQAVIRLNQARMDAYHELTLAQAANAYRNSQVAMAAGFVVLVGGAATALTAARGGGDQALIGGLAAVGTALSGFVVATFLQAQKEALSQLNLYFRQPLASSFLLTAERWALKLPTDTQPDALARMADQVVAHAFGDLLGMAPPAQPDLAPAGAPAA